MKKSILCILLGLVCAWSYGQQRRLEGQLLDRLDNTPIAGASIMTNGGRTTQSDENGRFLLVLNSQDSLITVRMVGYRNARIRVPENGVTVLKMERDNLQLGEVVVNTGYQSIPRERATGSFVHLDSALLNRSVSTNILNRLEDVTSGLIVNRNGSNANQTAGAVPDISVRGESTIYSETQPLIVVDNFPYSGDLSSINPNDVESITVLKDAAAASIWGARAGNGVIVITTRKGRQGQPTRVSFNTNLTIGDRPDLLYQSRMSSSDFIDVERMLFERGFYNAREQSTNHQPITPAVEIMIAERDGMIDPATAALQLDAMRGNDVWADVQRYFYRPMANQQYALSLSGASGANSYLLSAGYDRNLENLERNSFDRITLNASHSFYSRDSKLQLHTLMYLAQGTTLTNNNVYNLTSNTLTFVYPYGSLLDEQGRPANFYTYYRKNFLDNPGHADLLDWNYAPLIDLEAQNNRTRRLDYRLNANLSYKLLPFLKAELFYQYNGLVNRQRQLQDVDTYFARNLINDYSYIDASGVLQRHIPLGGILDLTNTTTTSHNVRGMLHVDHSWAEHHALTAIAGYELMDSYTLANVHRQYGYDSQHATVQVVDYSSLFGRYSYPGSTARVPFNDSERDLTDRYLSYFANAGYSYRERYTATTSYRRDESNIFGVNTNQKGVPLYSLGLGWNASNETFYNSAWLPYLKLRATYGHSGNVNKSLSALIAARYWGTDALTGLPYAQITNPPNPELRWEKVRTINLGVDFALKGDKLAGTLEYYDKRSTDLIGVTSFPPSSGITSFTGNYASMQGRGLDLTLNSRNLDGTLKWTTNLLFSYNTDKVTDYDFDYRTVYALNGTDPVVGKPIHHVFSLAWGGLDPQNGDPLGYWGGEESKDYASMINSTALEDLIYHGPARPRYFGALRNNFQWKDVSLSFNVSYRLGYYIRKSTVQYYQVLRGEPTHGDYALRWQRPGDEEHTQIPSLPAVSNSYRDDFLTRSSAMIDKGDHIRLQDINLAYALKGRLLQKLSLKQAQLYVYANNLALLWKASNFDFDPDYQNLPPVRIYALGLKLDF
ncbi:SusC/RagA family TonB-linked outer membrane protein [Olivibacter sitiensis]|uniref:SusC/RagA family TonB-linked outer membrane protein n=1 Tax=Olivibacter sitiensis TaxID=376470 RepID=UPI00041A441C|nr:SusC/RagA family TonB-linked outer membrane protein [Olivibacter sitiensis]